MGGGNNETGCEILLGVIRLGKQVAIRANADYGLQTATTYSIGAIAAFWSVERLRRFWT
jgi:hypothetical protein